MDISGTFCPLFRSRRIGASIDVSCIRYISVLDQEERRRQRAGDGECWILELCMVVARRRLFGPMVLNNGAHFHLWREGTPEEGKGRRSLMHLQGQKSYSSQKSYKCSWSPYSVQDLVLGVSSTKTEALSVVPSAWVLAWVYILARPLTS